MSINELNDIDELDALQHSLGITTSRSGTEYRNYYAAEADDPLCLTLVSKGDMRIGRTIPGGLVYYHVTEQGKARARKAVPA